jgi:hypothetical protein
MKCTSIVVLLVAIGAAALLIARLRNSRTSSVSVAESSSTLRGQRLLILLWSRSVAELSISPISMAKLYL